MSSPLFHFNQFFAVYLRTEKQLGIEVSLSGDYSKEIKFSPAFLLHSSKPEFWVL
jgi:hypothetical protein